MLNTAKSKKKKKTERFNFLNAKNNRIAYIGNQSAFDEINHMSSSKKGVFKPLMAKTIERSICSKKSFIVQFLPNHIF